MRYIDKTNRLIEWDVYVRKSNPTVWNNSSKKERLKLHKHLHLQQNGLCIYCEQEILSIQKNTSDAIHPSHLEHVLPKSNALFAALIFDQDNLAMSCMGFKEGKYELDSTGRVKRAKGVSINYDFCGHPKDNKMDIGLFINPLKDLETHKYFNFDINGQIIPSDKNPEKAEYTINLLNLNHDDLVAWRLEVYNTLLEDTELDITAYLLTFPTFYSMIKNLWGIA